MKLISCRLLVERLDRDFGSVLVLPNATGGIHRLEHAQGEAAVSCRTPTNREAAEVERQIEADDQCVGLVAGRPQYPLRELGPRDEA